MSNASALGNPTNEVYINSYVNSTDGNLRFAISGTFANPIRNDGGLWDNTIGTGTNHVVLTGHIYGSGSLTKLGSGKLTITGNNTYSNGTTISVGTLQVGNGESAGKLGSGAVDNSGVLAFNLNTDLTVTNFITGSGQLQQIGSGTTILTEALNYVGNTLVSGGTLDLDASPKGRLYFSNPPTSSSNVVTVSNGGSLKVNDWNAGSSGSLGIMPENSDRIYVNDGNLIFGATFNSARGFRIGPGGATIRVTVGGSGTNAYVKSQGTASNRLSFASGSFLKVSGSGNATFEDSLGFSGSDPFGGSNNFEVQKEGAGILRLNRTNFYTGATKLNAGTMVIGSSGSTWASTSTIVAAGASLQVEGQSGAVTVQSNGTVRGSGRISSLLVHASGILEITNPVTSSTSPGIWNPNASMSLVSGYQLKVHLASSAPIGRYYLLQAASISSAVPVVDLGSYNMAGKTSSVSVVSNYLVLDITSTDTTSPVITLNGNSPMFLLVGDTFIDPGATVTDNVDAIRAISGTGLVNTYVAGSYTLTYSATDAAGNVATPVTRTLRVLSPVFDEDGDGFSNAEEISAGTSPVTSTSFPASGVTGRVFAWGWDTSDDPIQIPASVRSGVDQVAASPNNSFAVALKAGVPIVWALDNTATNVVATKLSVPANATSGVVQVAAGLAHVLGLKQNGSVVVWGDDPNLVGVISNAPPSSNTDFIAVASGDDHCLALKKDGTVVAWGRSTDSSGATGQLDFSGITNVVSLAGGVYHSLALKADGTLVGRGRPNYGAASIPSGLSNVTTISAGRDHSLALREDGQVFAWGRGDRRQTNIPNGTYAGNNLLPGVTATPAAQISGGRYYSLALRSDGRVVEWGDYYGGGSNSVAAETETPGWLTNVVTAIGSRYYSLVIRSDTAAPRLGIAQHSIQIKQGTSTNLPLKATVSSPTFSQVGLPAGVTLSASGELTAAPNATVTNAFVRIMVANSNGSDARVVNLQVASGDTIPPTITLKGSALVLLETRDTYTDAGVTVTDNLDSSIVPTAELTGAGILYPISYDDSFRVTDGVGSYTITYRARDAAGNQATPVTRTVKVFPNEYLAWALKYGLIGANVPDLAEDKDADGFESSIEFTTDTDPGLASSNPKPVIQSQPQGAGKVYGDGYFLSAVVDANHGPFTYAWRKDGSFLSGETNASLALASLKLTDAGNYSVVVANSYGSTTSSIASLSVGQARPNITWSNPVAITYGTALSTNQLNATSGVTGSFSYTPTNGVVLHAGTNTLTVVFRATDTTNYVSPVTNTVSLVVDKKLLSVSADNQSRFYGQPNPALTLKIQGFVAGQTNTALSSQPKASTDAHAASLTGIYPISVSGGTADNYAFHYVNGTLTVNSAQPPAAQPITWAAWHRLQGNYSDSSGNTNSLVSQTMPNGTGTNSTFVFNRNTAANEAWQGGGGNFLRRSSGLGSFNASNNQLTLSAWIKCGSAPYDQLIASMGRYPDDNQGQWTWSVAPSGQLYFLDFRDGFGFDGTSEGSVNDGAWHHVAFVRNGKSGTFYIDGVASGIITSSKNVSYNNIEFVVGGDWRNGHFAYPIADVKPWLGTIDDLAVTSTALTADQIKLVMLGDTDGDGLADSDEVTQGTDLAKADTDGDGVIDGAEVTAGTDPKSAAENPKPLISIQPNGASKIFGEVHVFTATATNYGPFAYQWRKDGSFLSGETNASLSLTSLKLADAGNYTVVVANSFGSTTSSIAPLNVGQATPSITWTNPAAITYGAALTTNQLNASSGVMGSFTYSPSNGVILNAGTNTLTAVFRATDTTNYVSPVTNTVSLVVNKASNTIGLAATDSKVFGANPYALAFTKSSTGALSYTSTVSGVATISSAGQVTIRGAGQTTLKVSQAGDDNYEAAPEASQVLTVTSTGAAISSGSGITTSGGITSANPSSATPILNLPASLTYGQKIALPGAVQGARAGETGLNLAIPDFNAGGFTRQLSLSGLDLASYRLTVGLRIDGTQDGAYLGDYEVYLRHNAPGDLIGQTRYLLDRAGKTPSDPTGALANGINAIFADAAETNVQNVSSTESSQLAGNFKIASLLPSWSDPTTAGGLNTMGGGNWNGTWTLFLADRGQGGTGNLVDWYMQFEDLSQRSASADTSNGLVYEVVNDPAVGDDGTDKASISGNELTATSGSGRITIRAAYPGGSAYTTNTITLNKKSQTITFPALGSRSLAPAFLANASTDSGLNLSYSSSDTNVVTVDSNGLITPVAAGSATITAAQAGDGNFSAASPASQVVIIVATPLTPYFGASQLYWQEGTNPAILGSRTGHLYEPIKYAEASSVAGIVNVQIVGAAAFYLSSTSQPSAGVVGYSEAVSPGMNSGFTSWSGLTNSLRSGNYEFQGKNSSFALVTNATLTWSNASNFPTAVPRLGGTWVSKALRLADPTTAGTVTWDTWSNRPSNGLIRLELEPEGYSSGGRLSSFLPAGTNLFEVPAGFLGTNRIYKLKLSFGVRESDGGVHANLTQVRLATGPNYPPSAPVLSNAVAGGVGVREGTNLVGTLELPADQDSGDSTTASLPFVSGGGPGTDNPSFELTTNAVDSNRMDLRLRSGNFTYSSKSQYQVLVRHTDSFGLFSETAYTVSVSRAQTITFSALPTKTYGDSAFDLEATASSGLGVSYASSNPNVAEITGNRVTIKGAGSATITASQTGGVNGWLAADPVQQVLTVGPKSLTVGAPTILAREYNGQKAANSVQVGTLSGFVHPETVIATATAADYPSANVGNYSNVVVTYTLQDGTNGGKASNYRLANGSATGVVTAKELTVGLPVIAPREYDGTKTAGLIQVGSLVGFVFPETVTATAVAADYSSAEVGTYSNVVVTYSLANGPNGGLATNYRIPDRTATGIITAKTLGSTDINLTAPANLVFNNSPKAFMASATGLGGETVLLNLTYESKDGGGNFSSLSGAPSAAGDYRVTATAAGNYGGFKQQEFTITKAGSTVTVTGTNSFTYSGNPQGPDTSSKTGSSGAVTYIYAGTNGTTYSAGATKPTAAGQYTAVASVAADDNYNGATSPAFAFTIAKVTPVMTAAPTASTITYGQMLSSSTLSGGTASVAGSFAFTAPTTTPNAGTAGQGVTFTPDDTANYNTVTTNLPVTVNRAFLTIAGLSGKNKAYDGSKTAEVDGAATLSGRVLSDGPSDVDLTGPLAFEFSDADAGTDKPIAVSGGSLSGSKAGNYQLSLPTNLKATIVAAGLPAVTFAPPSSLIYDGTAKTHSASATGPSSLNLSYSGRAGTSYGPSGTAPSRVGDYTVTATTSDNNYSGSRFQEFSITRKGLTISGASAVNRAYNGGTNVVVSGGTLSGVESGDSANVTLGGSPAGTVASAAVGTGKSVTVTGYTISGSAASNYSLAQPTDVTVDISKATQSIAFTLAQSSVLSSVTTVNLTASATSGLTVSFESSSASVATVSGSTLTIVGPGVVTITAKQAGNGNYEAATDVPQVLTVVDVDLPIAGADSETAAPILGEPAKYPVAKLLINDRPSANPSDTRTISITGVAANSTRGGTVSRKGNWIIYQPNASAISTGTDSFTYTLSNGAKTAMGTVNLALTMPDFTLRIAIENMVDRVGGGKTVTFAVSPNKTFEVQATSDLANWTTINATATSFSDGRLVVDDPGAGSARFYRVRWIP